MTWNYDYCKCLKCDKLFKSLDFEKLGKDGCLDCQSKSLEWKIPIGGYYLIWITEECSKCSKPKVNDIINWEEYKEKSGRTENKPEVIKAMNEEDDKCCHCKTERERETKISLQFNNYELKSNN